MPDRWMPRERWDAAKSGEGCPMCADVATAAVAQPGHVNTYGYTIADLPHSILRLSTDQFTAGYCILMSKAHGPEPYDLSPERSSGYFTDLTRASQAVATAMKADKMNFLLLGNAVPHLHAHLIPRYYGDPAPHAPLLSDPDRPVLLSATEYRHRAGLIGSILE